MNTVNSEKCVSCVNQCPHSCFKSACRNKTAPVLESIGCPSLPELATSDKVSNNYKWLYTSPQERLPDRDVPYYISISGFLQQSFGSQTQQEVETYTRSELTEQIEFTAPMEFTVAVKEVKLIA